MPHAARGPAVEALLQRTMPKRRSRAMGRGPLSRTWWNRALRRRRTGKRI